MKGRIRAISAEMLAAAGTGALAVSMLVIWSGQPAPDSRELDVLQYYSRHAGRIRFGEVVWIAGILAIVASAVMIRDRLNAIAGRWYVGGLAVCGAIMILSGVVAFGLAGAAADGTLSGPALLERWQLERGLFDGARVLFVVPVIAGAISLDRERSFGAALTAIGLVVPLTLALPVSPWNFLALLAWIVGATAFAAHVPHQEVYVDRRSFRPHPAVAA